MLMELSTVQFFTKSNITDLCHSFITLLLSLSISLFLCLLVPTLSSLPLTSSNPLTPIYIHFSASLASRSHCLVVSVENCNPLNSRPLQKTFFSRNEDNFRMSEHHPQNFVLSPSTFCFLLKLV